MFRGSYVELQSSAVPEQTAKLLKDDPDVKAGLLKLEIHPLAMGKGVLASGQTLQ